MSFHNEPINKRLRQMRPDEKFEITVQMQKEPPFIGNGETAGYHSYLCSGCGRTLFRRFKPNGEAFALAFACRCGQTNVFEKEAERPK